MKILPMSSGYSDWKWLINSLSIRSKEVKIALILTALTYILGIVYPLAFQKFIDAAVSGRYDSGVAVLLLVSALSLLFEIRCSLKRHRIILETGIFVDKQIMRSITLCSFSDNIKTSNEQNAVLLSHYQEAAKVRDFVLYRLPDFLFDFGGAIIACIIITGYDVYIGLAVLLIIFPGLRLGGKSLKNSRHSAEGMYETSGERQRIISETVSSIAVIKASSLERFQLDRLNRAVKINSSNLRKLVNSSLDYWFITQIVSRYGSFIIITLGCFRLYHGHITFGELIAIQILSSRVMGPLVALGDLSRSWNEVSVAANNIAQFLNCGRMNTESKAKVRSLNDTSFSLEKVSYTYEGQERPSLCDININLPAKGLVAIVGRNGSGKSTLTKLLLGLNKEFDGYISIGGTNVRDMPARWLRRQIAVVSQNDILLGNSLREMICQGRKTPAEQVEAAKKFACATSFIEGAPGDLDTYIMGGAYSFSGGQRQKLAIARCFLRDPRIAILDEPTSALDSESAATIENHLFEWAKNRLVIVVTHNLHTVKRANQIVVLDSGRLDGFGDHESLIYQSETYVALWKDFNRVV